MTILDDQLYRQKTQLWGKRNYRNMNNDFLHLKNIVFKSKANAIFFFNLKKREIKNSLIFVHIFKYKE